MWPPTCLGNSVYQSVLLAPAFICYLCGAAEAQLLLCGHRISLISLELLTHVIRNSVVGFSNSIASRCVGAADGQACQTVEEEASCFFFSAPQRGRFPFLTEQSAALLFLLLSAPTLPRCLCCIRINRPDYHT